MNANTINKIIVVLLIITMAISTSALYYAVSSYERISNVEEALSPTAPAEKVLTWAIPGGTSATKAGRMADIHFHGGGSPPLMTLTYEPLFLLDPAALMVDKIEIIPWLAKNYSVSPDGTVYTIDLRRGVTFHNTNNTMTAEDVKYSFDRLWTADWPLDITGGYLPKRFDFSYDRTEVVDDYRVKIYLKFPNPAFLDTLCKCWWGIYEKAELEAHAKIGEGGLSDHGYEWIESEPCHDVGTGPYRIKEFRLLERYEIERCENYWGGPPELDLPEAEFDTLIEFSITDEADARMRLIKGDLDLLFELSPDVYVALGGMSGIEVFSKPSGVWCELMMHCVSGPLQHWKVRKAIKTAINYDVLADDIMKGTAFVYQGCFAMGMPGAEKTARYYTRDVEEAKELLDEAGYPDPGEPGEPGGWRFSLIFHGRVEPRFGMDTTAYATVLKENLAEIGIDLDIDIRSAGEWFATFLTPSIEGMWPTFFSTLSWTEPNTLLGHYVLEPHASGWNGFNETTQKDFVPDPINFTYMRDTYIKAMGETDPDERVKIWQELDAYVLEYGSAVHLVLNTDRIAYTDKLKGFYHWKYQGMMPFVFYFSLEE